MNSNEKGILSSKIIVCTKNMLVAVVIQNPSQHTSTHLTTNIWEFRVETHRWTIFFMIADY